MGEGLAAIIARARATYPFRGRGPFESEAQYREALIAHVETRDFALAHELRVGRAQVEWSPADVQAFRDHIEGLPGPRTEAAQAPRHIMSAKVGLLSPALMADRAAATAALDGIATKGLDALVARRRQQPLWQIPVFITVLLESGDILVTSTGRGDRVAVIKALAQSMPVFGFTCGTDVFVHGIALDAAGGATGATKRDALIMHVGTRDLRIVKVRPYAIRQGRVYFDDPPPPDKDLRTPDCQDPYSEIFVTVPPVQGVQ